MVTLRHATMTMSISYNRIAKIDQVIADFNKFYLKKDPMSVICFEQYFQSLKSCVIVKSNTCRVLNENNYVLTASHIFQLKVVAQKWFFDIYPFTGNEIHGVSLNWDLSDYDVICHSHFCFEFEKKLIDIIKMHSCLLLNVEEIQLKLFYEMTIYHSEQEVADYMKKYFWVLWEVNKKYWEKFMICNENIDQIYWPEIMNNSKSKEFITPESKRCLAISKACFRAIKVFSEAS